MHFNPAIYEELSANKMRLISDVERYSECIHNFLHFGFSLKMAFFPAGQEDNDNCSKCWLIFLSFILNFFFRFVNDVLYLTNSLLSEDDWWRIWEWFVWSWMACLCNIFLQKFLQFTSFRALTSSKVLELKWSFFANHFSTYASTYIIIIIFSDSLQFFLIQHGEYTMANWHQFSSNPCRHRQ